MATTKWYTISELGDFNSKNGYVGQNSWYWGRYKEDNARSGYMGVGTVNGSSRNAVLVFWIKFPSFLVSPNITIDKIEVQMNQTVSNGIQSGKNYATYACAVGVQPDTPKAWNGTGQTNNPKIFATDNSVTTRTAGTTWNPTYTYKVTNRNNLPAGTKGCYIQFSGGNYQVQSMSKFTMGPNTYPLFRFTYTDSSSTPTNYTITYYRNFDTSDNTTKSGGTVASGDYYILNDCYWTREGYSFNGWVASPSSSEIYDPGSSVQAFNNQTWYATWVQNGYTVNFYPGDHANVSNIPANAISRTTEGGRLTLLSSTAFTGEPDYTYYTTNYYLQGGDVTSYNYPSSSSRYTRSGSSSNYCYSVEDDKKTDYSYEYWRGSDGYLRQCGDTYTNLNQDMDMWPNWTGTTNYNAQFNPPDASRTGYRLSGWATSPAGTPNYQSGANYQQSSNQNLYAIWEASEFKITFSPGNYGQGSSEELTTTNGQLTTLPSNYFTRPAGTTYYFNYYLQGGTMSTPPGFLVDTSVTYGPHYQTSNKTTYYHNYWNNDPNGSSKNNMGVDCWSCGATYSFTSDMTIYPEWGSIVPKYTLPTPTKVGYKFVAWNTNAQGTGTNYAAGTEFALRSNKTFYAIWEPEWTIKINNGTNWGDYHVWIYTGATSNNGWQQAIPYVYDGSNWKLTKI